MTAHGDGSRRRDPRIDEALDQDWADLDDPSVLARLGSSLVDDKANAPRTAPPAEDVDASASTYRVDGTPPPAPGRLPRR